MSVEGRSHSPPGDSQGEPPWGSLGQAAARPIARLAAGVASSPETVAGRRLDAVAGVQPAARQPLSAVEANGPGELVPR